MKRIKRNFKETAMIKQAHVFELPGFAETEYTIKITPRFDEILTTALLQNASVLFFFNKIVCYCTTVMMRTARTNFVFFNS